MLEFKSMSSVVPNSSEEADKEKKIFFTKTDSSRTEPPISTPIRKFKLLKESCVNVLSESTAHGIPGVFKEKHLPVRIFWGVLFLAGSAAASYCMPVFLK